MDLRYRLHRLRDTAWRKAAHALPPRLKYLATIDMVAGISTLDLPATHVPEIRAMDVIGLYEKRHHIR